MANERVDTLIERLQRETDAARVNPGHNDTTRIIYWSAIHRIRGAVLDIAHEEGFKLDFATTRKSKGYAEFVPLGAQHARVDHTDTTGLTLGSVAQRGDPQP